MKLSCILPNYRGLVALAALTLSAGPLTGQSVPGTWTQTLNEDFTSGTLNTTIWSPHLRWGPIINNEKQYYDAPNLTIAGGILSIKSEKRSITRAGYTQNYASGAISSHGKWAQTYGLFEARMKLPSATAMWPAFWLMPDRGPSFPDSGNPGRWDVGNGGIEYDIMEHIGGWGDFSHTAHHWAYGSGGYEARGAGGKNVPALAVPGISTGFHTYSLYWGPGVSIMYIDGVEVDRYEGPRNGSVPHYMILNTAMGGVWADAEGYAINDAQLPAYTEIDWVRVYTGTPANMGYTSLQGVDINAKNWLGSNSVAGGVHTISAGGVGIGGRNDECRFVGKQTSGNVQIVARVTNLVHTDWWALAGPMIRDNLDSNSPMAMAFSAKGGKVGFSYRFQQEQDAFQVNPDMSTPRWYRLTRTGNVFTAESCTDGVSWAPLGSPQTIFMEGDVFVGLAVTSHANTTLTTATIDNVTITETPALTGQDIGSVALAGSNTVNASGVHTIQASGADIWGANDAFRYVHQLRSGDGEMVARVTGITNTDWWAKAGVMVRENLNANSRNAMVLASVGALDSFQYRSAPGVSTAGSNVSVSSPWWVKIKRVGDLFSSFHSTNGTSWTPFGTPQTLAIPSTAYWGLAVTSHDNTELTTATIQNVSLTGVQAPRYHLFSYHSLAAEDGYIEESTETSNVGGAMVATVSDETVDGLRSGDLSNDRQLKSIVSFDTSSLPDGCTIVSAKLRLRRGAITGTDPYTTHGVATVDIKGGSGFGGSAALAVGDFQASADSVGVCTLTQPGTVAPYADGMINAAGLNHINKTGKTQFRIYFPLDDNDDVGDDYYGWTSGEHKTPSLRPTLEVVYY